MVSFRRGSIVWVSVGSGEGSEQNRRRPAVVVSNDGANTAAQGLGRGVVTIVPLTSSSRAPHAFQVVIPATLSGLRKNGLAQAEQIRSVDVTRVTATKHVLPKYAVENLDSAIKIHLSLL